MASKILARLVVPFVAMQAASALAQTYPTPTTPLVGNEIVPCRQGTGFKGCLVSDITSFGGKPISIAAYLSPAQLADVQARTQTLDVTSAVQSWLAACEAQHRPCEAISGVYKVSGQIAFEQAGNLSNGLTVFTSSPGQAVFNSSYTGGVPFSLQASGGTPSNPASSSYAMIWGIAFQCNYAGPCLQIGKPDLSDQINEATLFRVTIQNFNNSASSSAAQWNSTYSGFYFVNAATAAAPGQIASFGTITGGSGYANGSYTNVPLTDVSGSNQGQLGTANITVSGGAVTAVAVNNAGTLYQANDVVSAAASNLGGAGSGFQVSVATVTNNQNDLFKVTNTQFSRFFLGGSSAYNWLHLASGFSYGNAFFGADCEVVNYCVLIDSPNAQQNTWYSGRFAYAFNGTSASAGGGDNTFVNPNTQLPTSSTFVASGSASHVQVWTNETLAPIAAPTFTGSATVAATGGGNASFSAINGSYNGLSYEDTSGNYHVANNASGKFTVFDQAGNGSYQWNINGSQVALQTGSLKTYNTQLKVSGGTVTCGTGCASVSGSAQSFAVTGSAAAVTAINLTFSGLAANPTGCTLTAGSTSYSGALTAVSSAGITIGLPSTANAVFYGHCF